MDGATPEVDMRETHSVPDGESRPQPLLDEAEALILSDIPRARTLTQRARELAQPGDHANVEARAEFLDATCLFFQGDYSLARDGYDHTVSLAHQLNHAALQARALNGLGITHHKLGSYGNAMEYLHESLRLAREQGDELGVARAISNLGLLHTELGEHQRALELHLEAHRMAEHSGRPLYECGMAVNVVVGYTRLQQFDEAVRYAHTASRLLSHARMPQMHGILLGHLAMAFLGTGRLTEAIATCLDALPICRGVGDRETESLILAVLGRAQADNGDPTDGTASLLASLEIAERIGASARELEAHAHLAVIHERHERWREALRHVRAEQAVERRIRAQENERRASVAAAMAMVELHKHEVEQERRRNTELELSRARLVHEATHDALTGLANRVLFQQQVEEVLQRGEDAALHAILFLDLDDFKAVNDTYGHGLGDELLRAVATRLTATVRATDLVARLGGDEFTVLLRNLNHPDSALRVANNLLDRMRDPYQIGGLQLRVTVSIGVAIAPHDGSDVTTLHRHADSAMYDIKRHGRNGAGLYQHPHDA